MSVLDRFRLDGKRLFITGGSRGLGREMALGIAEAGADVILVGREPASLDRTADDVRARGRQAFTIQADVGRPEEAERACRTALGSGGTCWPCLFAQRDQVPSEVGQDFRGEQGGAVPVGNVGEV